MDLGLSGKHVFVAGASRGIGLGIVTALLEEGAKVALTARGASELTVVSKGLADRYGADRVWAKAGDMRETAVIEAALSEAVDALGPLHGAVANVGLHPCPPGASVPDDIWDAGFAQNLHSAYRLARAAIARLEGGPGGGLLMISSIAGLAALGTALTYGTSKAAMNHLTKELAALTGPKNIRVNAIAPGNIIFPGGEWETRINGPRADAWTRWIKREVPLRRFGAPEEIGAMAAFLLSDRASFITGAVIPVDGGQTK